MATHRRYSEPHPEEPHPGRILADIHPRTWLGTQGRLAYYGDRLLFLADRHPGEPFAAPPPPPAGVPGFPGTPFPAPELACTEAGTLRHLWIHGKIRYS